MRRSYRPHTFGVPGFVLATALAAAFLVGGGCAKKTEPATLVLLNGDIYTVNPVMPAAKAVVITDNTITAVCATDKEARRYVGEKTNVVDLAGKFVTPGLNDAHVHINSAGAQINGANLLAVSDEAGLRKEIRRVVNLLDDGEWITEGLWGAYEQWTLGDAGRGGGAICSNMAPWCLSMAAGACTVVSATSSPCWSARPRPCWRAYSFGGGAGPWKERPLDGQVEQLLDMGTGLAGCAGGLRMRHC